LLNRVIALSLAHRSVVLFAAVALTVVGLWQLPSMPVDVFPDLNRPVVTVMTEAPGLAPEEVEMLVTRPLEYLLNGATGVARVRSASAIGFSIVWVEFGWGTDVYRDRQIVAEKIQLAKERLPAGSNPVLAPISSIMGEIMLLGLRHDKPAADENARRVQQMELRTLAEFTVRNRLLAVEGVSQVAVMGGMLKEFQIITSPERLASQNVTLQQLVDAAEKANVIAGGGVVERGDRESLLRISGQSATLDDVAETPVAWKANRPVRIRDVAEVRFGGPVRRGDGSVRVKAGDGVVGGSAVVLTVQKQPDANTLELDPKIDEAIERLKLDLPPGVVIESHVFRQADFIRTAVDNVVESIRDGTVWVVLVLLLFLGNLRVSLITLVAIPLSVLSTLLVFRWVGVSINTMTLGGLAVAVGELVDDAVVDVENIFRRLRENRARHDPLPAIKVIYLASAEVRNSIVYATLVVCTVVVPLFALSGLEGRMFAPLGLAYLLSLLASLVVSLTVTPALASYLLPGAKFLERKRDPPLLRLLKRIVEPLVRLSIRHPWKIVGVVAVFGVGSKLLIFWMGSEFLPEFNEGTATLSVQIEPGASLAESVRVADRAEAMLLEVPEVEAVVRRTGRAELDEHAEGVNSSEIDVRIAPHEQPKQGIWFAVLRAVPGLRSFGVTTHGRPHAEVLADVRERVTLLPNVRVNVGQPISHRLDHMLSGVRAQVAVKIFGHDLRNLREAAHQVEEKMAGVAGVVDLQIEPQVEIPQIRLQVRRQEAARYGLAPGDVARLIETAMKGRAVSLVLDEEKSHRLVVWFDEESRGDPETIGKTILDTPSGRRVSLSQVAEVLDTTGPNTINRENVERRIVVSCNVEERDLGNTVAEIQRAIAPIGESLLRHGAGHRLEIGGQFEAQQQAGWRLSALAAVALVVVFLLLSHCFDSWRAALIVLLVNIPLAAVGSVAALLIVNRPHWEELAAEPWWNWLRLWAGETTLSLAHWVGFITLVGIVTRNGIMMISHYQHLMKHEGEGFTESMIVRGTLERLAPVLMTALTAILGLIPLALGAGQPGKEILYPLAVVVIGGLLDAAILDQVVTPAVFFKFGRKASPSSGSEERDAKDAT
jgi:CzcA family heavy metal efflux pump